MNHSRQQRKSVAISAIFCGLFCEAAAVLPFVAPEVRWVAAAHAPLLHLATTILVAGGAGAALGSGRGFSQWTGLACFFGIFALLIPVAGVIGVLVLAAILYGHHRQEQKEKIEFEDLPTRQEALRDCSATHDAGPLKQPLVGMVESLDADQLRQVVLGLDGMPAASIRPLLHRLQKHSDVRVQLYANGLLNDQLDALERRLAVLKKRVAEDPADEPSRTAIVETFTTLFDHGLVAADEIDQTAGQALEESKAALAQHPGNGPVLKAHVEFLLLRGDHREASLALAQLQALPGQQPAAAALLARLQYEQAAMEEIPVTPISPPESGEQASNAGNL